MMRTTITLLVAIVLLASCNQYQKTPSGLSYKITKGDGKVPLKNGMFVKFNIEYKVPPKDSILTSSFGHVPAFLMIDTSRPAKHSFLEIITKCAVGDKIDFVMSVDTLKKLGMIEYNNIFHARDMIKGRVEILKAYTSQADAATDNAKEGDIEKQKEVKELQDYVTRKGIKTQATPSGALVEITNAGDPTQKADTGKQVKLKYKGTFLKDGKPFDTNVDAAGNLTGQPLTFTIGAQGVIPGMEDAARMFAKGGKGRMFIPAMLAYGQAGSPPIIPPYASLVFEIEVIDVSVPPPPAPQPQMPGAPQAQPKK